MKSDLENQSQVNEVIETEIVQVYMRNVKKQARLVQLHSPAKSSDLAIIASTRFNIPEERVVIFYSGFRVDNYSKTIPLTDKSIMHVLDRRNLGANKINVSFKPIGWNVPTFRLSLSPDITMKQIMNSYLVPQLSIQEHRFFIVYAGKTLNTSNTLREQYVEDESELVVIQHRSTRESFQKEALQYNTSYHIEDKNKSTVLNCPVTYQTTVDSLKKKNQQQTALLHQQNMNQLSQAGPKPFPLPPFPVMGDSFLNNNNVPFNINISTIKPQDAELPEEPVAPLDKSSKKPSKQSSDVQRCAPFPQEKSGEIKIKINKNLLDSGHDQKLKPNKDSKAILQLNSNYQTNSSNSAIPFPIFSKESSQKKSEKDNFAEPKSASPE